MIGKEIDKENIAKSIIKYSEELGVKEIEIFMSETKTKACFIENNRITNFLENISEGVGIRVIVNDKIGFSYGNLIKEEDYKKILRRAIVSSKFGSLVDNFNFAKISKKNIVKDIYDEEIENSDEKFLIEFCGDFLKRLRNERISFGRTRFSTIEYSIVNSNGLKASEKSTFVTFYSNVLNSVEYEILEKGRRIEDIKKMLDSSFENALNHIENYKEMKNAKIKKKNVEAILSPSVLTELFISTFGYSLSGNSFVIGNSPFLKRIGEKIASEKITMIDDGTLPKGLGSFSIDHEGIPTRKKILIKNGVLKNFFFDLMTANIVKKKSTGNGLRNVFSEELYSSPPNPTITNLIIKNGKKYINDIISETKDGIFIDKVSWPRASPFSGSFSLEIRIGYTIKDGCFNETIKDAILVGNFYELIKNVEEISKENEYKSVSPSGFGECALMPYIKFKNIMIMPKRIKSF